MKLKVKTKLKLLKRDFLLSFKRKKENKFDYIFSLGYNCEVAFKFYRFFKFEESCIFNWVYNVPISDFVKVLNDMDLIGKTGFNKPNPLWECKTTHLRFHGKADMSLYINNEATEEMIEQDRNDLIERLAYLKSKFIKFAKSDCKKLYVYKVFPGDADESKIQDLYSALKNLGAKNFKLLIITEKAENFKPEDTNDIMYRQVDYYAPPDEITSPKYFNNGFDKIWEEFYCPDNTKHRNKKYKFE